MTLPHSQSTSVNDIPCNNTECRRPIEQVKSRYATDRKYPNQRLHPEASSEAAWSGRQERKAPNLSYWDEVWRSTSPTENPKGDDHDIDHRRWGWKERNEPVMGRYGSWELVVYLVKATPFTFTLSPPLTMLCNGDGDSDGDSNHNLDFKFDLGLDFYTNHIFEVFDASLLSCNLTVKRGAESRFKHVHIGTGEELIVCPVRLPHLRLWATRIDSPACGVPDISTHMSAITNDKVSCRKRRNAIRYIHGENMQMFASNGAISCMPFGSLININLAYCLGSSCMRIDDRSENTARMKQPKRLTSIDKGWKYSNGRENMCPKWWTAIIRTNIPNQDIIQWFA